MRAWPSPLVLLLSALAASATLVASSPAEADDYPSKPITLLVGFAPGGGGDFVARLLGRKLSESLGQPVIVDNKGGANGQLAANAAAAAKPDGYTLFVPSMGLATNPHLYPQTQKDPSKIFTPISLLVMLPNVVVTSPTLPTTSLQELIAYSRTKGPVTMATVGAAAPGDLVSELLQRSAHVKFQHVPYKGSGPGLADVVAGRVDMAIPSVVAAAPLVSSGKLRAIAVTGAKRTPLLPDVPTLAEAGQPELGNSSGWYGLVAPAGVDRKIVERLSKEMIRILEMPDVRERLANAGAEPVGSTSSEFAVFLEREYRRWGELIKAASIKADNT